MFEKRFLHFRFQAPWPLACWPQISSSITRVQCHVSTKFEVRLQLSDSEWIEGTGHWTGGRSDTDT